MPRPLRVLLPGAAVHIIQRGVNRNACFRSDSDYIFYLMHLKQLSVRQQCAVHAYCLMTNHVHLLLSPSTGEACSAMMKDLGQQYAQYFNRAYGRSGPLWDGRYRSCVAESARYVLACYRYIELNPVRAGMVPHPGHYPWSSYHANAEGTQTGFVSVHPEFEALGQDAATRRGAYARLLETSLDTKLVDDIRAATNGGYPLGTDSFKARYAMVTGGRTEPGRRGRKPAY
jgi:putative transposase